MAMQDTDALVGEILRQHGATFASFEAQPVPARSETDPVFSMVT